ncbi:MAG: formamidopyrimidine-DNA glycosylase [Gemmatimonadetes bacterium]|nr:formamidopyrimidine-DNA glycosylase [Gemmatimonadota bacterium]NNK64490.1 formamidopyrimidine-DNA glycosylase [Gemmatimonadota bacterium]
MPELPEISAYLRAFEDRIVGRALQRVRLRSPSFLRTFDPPLSSVEGRVVGGVRRLGKRVVWALEGDLFVVVHLMVTGRFHRRAPGVALPKKHAHAAFDFDDATYLVTERGKQKKASLHVVAGEAGLADHDRGGVEPLTATLEEFVTAVTSENRTLKRALTDPRILSGIGNAHSDEILHAAGLSPVQRTRNLTPEQLSRLRDATVTNLDEWTRRLADEIGDRFPEKITAFHPAMAVHGRYGEPCPVCGDPIQRIVYASRETNYCATCQTEGRVLADRAISRLLREDWPRTLEELEEHRESRRRP